MVTSLCKCEWVWRRRSDEEGMGVRKERCDGCDVTRAKGKKTRIRIREVEQGVIEPVREKQYMNMLNDTHTLGRHTLRPCHIHGPWLISSDSHQ